MVSIIGFKFYFVSLYVQRQQAIVPDILRSVDANLFQKGYFQLEMVVFSALIGIALSLPMIGHLRSPEGKLRWNEVNIFQIYP